jgi:hypothetical protein
LIISIGDRENELVHLFDIGPELVTPFYLLMHRNLQRTARVRAFFDFVIAEIKDFRSIQRATEVEKSRINQTGSAYSVLCKERHKPLY